MFEIAKRIEQNFDQGNFKLNDNKKFHFALRLYRISGKEKYKIIVRNLIVQDKNVFWEDLVKTSLQEYPSGWEKINLKRGKYISNSFFGIDVKDSRLKYYCQNPGLFFAQYLLGNMYTIKPLGLSSFFPILWDKALSYLAHSKLIDVYQEESFSRVLQGEAVNAIYELCDLGLITKSNRDQAIKRSERIFLSCSSHDNNWFLNVYALTHIIISESCYYQQKVDYQKFAEIINYFRKNLDYIIDLNNPDVAAEVGICFRLCSLNNQEIFNKLAKVISSHFNNGKGMLTRGKLPQGQKEYDFISHRNIVAMIFLNDWDNLFKGPDFSQDIKLKKQLKEIVQNKIL